MELLGESFLDSWKTAEEATAVLLRYKTNASSYYTSVCYIPWEQNKRKKIQYADTSEW